MSESFESQQSDQQQPPNSLAYGHLIDSDAKLGEIVLEVRDVLMLAESDLEFKSALRQVQSQ